MKLLFTYILASLLVCFSTSYAIEGQWTSDKYPNVVLTVRGHSTNLDGTNVYQISVNSCPFVYKIQIDQSYATMLNLEQKKDNNNCSLLNSSTLAQEIQQKIFYFYINYNKLGFVSIFGNKTNVFTRLSKNSTNDYLNGQYRDIVTDQIVVFRNNTVYLCEYDLEGDYLTDNFNRFQLNISSVVNNQCQSKGNDAQRVLQFLGQANNYRVQNQNILTFYSLAKPTLRLKFVQKATQPPKKNDENKNATSNSSQTSSSGSANFTYSDKKTTDSISQSNDSKDNNTSNKNTSTATISNSSTTLGDQKGKADQPSKNSTIIQKNHTISSTQSTATSSSKAQSNTSSSQSSSSTTNSVTTTTSTIPQNQNKNITTPTSNQIPKKPQNPTKTTTTTTSNSTSSTSNSSSSASTSTSSISTNSTSNATTKNQTSIINPPESSTSIQEREPFSGIEIRNQNSIGVWNVEYFNNPQVDNWPGRIRLNGIYLVMAGCNTISIPTRLNANTQSFIASSTGIISTRKACGDADQANIDAITKANRFEPVRNSTSVMLNFYQNDILLWSMSRNFNQGEAQTIKDVSKGQSTLNNQSNNRQNTYSQVQSNEVLNSISPPPTTPAQPTIRPPPLSSSPTSTTPTLNTSSKPSQTINSQPATPANTIINPPSNSNSPQNNSTILIGKYNPNSLYLLNLPPVLSKKYTYTFNPSSVSVVGTCNSYKFLYSLQQQSDSYIFSVDQSSRIQQKPKDSTCDPIEDVLYVRILFQAKSIQQSTNNGITKLNLLNDAGRVIAVLAKEAVN